MIVKKQGKKSESRPLKKQAGANSKLYERAGLPEIPFTQNRNRPVNLQEIENLKRRLQSLSQEVLKPSQSQNQHALAQTQTQTKQPAPIETNKLQISQAQIKSPQDTTQSTQNPHFPLSQTHAQIKREGSENLSNRQEVPTITPRPSQKDNVRKDVAVLEEYQIEIDKAGVTVSIVKDKDETRYELSLPELNIASIALLREMRNELVAVMNISMKELIDPEAFVSIKERFIVEAKRLLRQKLPNIEKNVEEYLVGTLIQDMLGLGKIEFLINDPILEEIVIQSAKENVRVYSKKYGWINTNIKIGTEDEIINYANIIARRVGRQITVLTPLLDAHLITGDRINAVLYPIDTKGSTITIRKFARDPYTIIDMIKQKTCDIDVAALIWLAIEYEMNVLISGGTASGKTSFLNACLPFIPPNQRIISIEDTRELMLPEFLYWSPLVTRTPNPEGKGEVSMLDLLINSLRMRPDRIILGEMRRHEEAMVLFEAMHTGHSVYATVHADSAAETISRLVNPPLNVPPNLLKAVNLNIVMFRDRRKGIRRVLQVAEFDAAKDSAKANIIYRWTSEEDKMIKHSESSRFYEDIQRNTGMSPQEVDRDLSFKKAILLWMINNGIRKLSDLGKVMDTYYKNKNKIVEAITKNQPSIILGK